MVPTEIERKYTINYLPNEIKKIFKITQKHIYRDSVCSIRVRKSEDLSTNEVKYTHTIKAKGKETEIFSITELEKEITEEQFEEVKPFKGSNIIEKYRVIIPLEDGLKAEVDIFEKKLKGLIIVEVEFESVEQAKTFKMPSWFEKEVPHNEFSNRKMSTKTRKEILELIGKKQLAINEQILKEFIKRMKNNSF